MAVGRHHIYHYISVSYLYDACGAYESHAHIGPISSVVAFELLHVVIFWFSLFLLISRAGQPRKLVYVGLFIGKARLPNFIRRLVGHH